MDIQTARADIRAGFAFFTRLPLAPPVGEANALFAFARATWVVPIVGASVGAIGAIAFLASHWLGLGDEIAALLAIGTLVLVTGALHEDGLADCADGFGGGTTRERKLDIMRDSRLGTYGTIALVLTIGLRAAALARCAEFGALGLAAIMVGAGALSRVAALWPLAALPPARPDGAGASAAPPTRSRLAIALLVACLALAPSAAFAGFGHAFAAFVLAGGVTFASTRLADSQIQGQTGDVVGTVQQGVELAVYLAFAAVPFV